jgi:ribonuclease HII
MNQNSIIAGIDDATKCPCIGSIFVAGVVADQKTIKYWKRIGVKDSKLITAKKREKLASIIKETALGYSIHEMTPQMIDDKRLNLNAWEMLTLLKITQDLYRYAPHTIYVDNWEVTSALFEKRFADCMQDSIKNILLEYQIMFDKSILAEINFIAEHRADENHTIVGAASILAKTSSDAQYRTYKQMYGDFGSGSPADPRTRLFVWNHRQHPVPIIRTSWNTYKVLVTLDDIQKDVIYSRVKKQI